MRKYLLILLGSFVAIICWAKPDLIYRYWFDSDGDNMVEGKATGDDLHIDADVNTLSECMHVLHLQIFDGDTPGAVVSRLFVKSPAEIGNDCLRYWFDSDHKSAQTISANPATVGIDVSGLSEGLHILNVQTAGREPSSVRSSMFIKVPQTIGAEYLTCVTYVDGSLYTTDRVDSNAGVMHYDMPIAQLSKGLHSLSVQLVTPKGGASELKSCFFLRNITGNEISRMRCFYSIDGISNQSEATAFDNGDFHFDVDVATVKDGLHSITYMLTEQDGSVSDIKTGMFYKIPVGGHGLSQYWYWINENNDVITKVEVEGLPDELNITKLLPVESYPFRSSLFHFEIDKNGVPYVYAANEFHFRAYSNDLYSAEMSKVYADYSVSKKVDNVVTLNELSGSITRECPAQNDILWYKVNATIGDSLRLRTDYAATIQVFDPKSKEVYSASGADATKDNGLHTTEEGVYYIAVHDVTTSYASNITLDYDHIAKYAVLEYTPDEVGVVKGDINISLSGNGYDKLIGAKLNISGTTIPINKIDVIDKCHANLRLKLLDEMKKGIYDLNLEFEDKGEKETLSLKNAITMAEPEFGDIKVNIYDYPISALTQPVEITITNSGNVAYRNIPIELGWSTNNLDRWNVDLPLKSDDASAQKDKNPFIFVEDLYNEGEKGSLLPILISNLESGESLSFILWYNIAIGQNFNLSAFVSRPWSLGQDTAWYGTEGEYGLAETTDNVQIDDYDWKDVYADDEGHCDMTIDEVEKQLESDDTDVDNEYDMLDEISAMVPSSGNSAIRSDFKYFRTKFRVIRRSSNNSHGSGSNPGYGSSGNNGKKKSKLTKKNVRSNMSYDPNDIYGYLSPAETHFIKKGLKDIFYTVEFENDPKTATASAHHIEVTNKIDKSRLDISTLKSKLLKISNKSVDLSEFGQNFVTTVDMRPEINALAQFTQTVDTEKGVVDWDIIALDPMTLEPTLHYMQGILPVNDSEGNGTGEIVYDISLKDGLSDGTSITNSASIVFDEQTPIETPVWENIIDAVNPVSRVSKAMSIGDDEALLTVEGNDSRSGIWKYDIYSHVPGSEIWTLVAENAALDDNSQISVKVEQCDNLEFCSIAYDKAGNVESKSLRAETSLAGFIIGDANNDGMVNIADYTVIINHILGKKNDNFLFAAADIDGDGVIRIADATSIVNLVLGKIKKLPERSHFSNDKTTIK